MAATPRRGCSSTRRTRRRSRAGMPRITSSRSRPGGRTSRLPPGWPRSSRRTGPRPSRRSTSRRPSWHRCPTSSSRCWRPWRPTRSTIPTGCSRSSGTAIASRRSFAAASSGCIPATGMTRRPTSPSYSRRRTGSTPRRPSSTARSSRSTRPAAPTSACSRSGSASPMRAAPPESGPEPDLRPQLAMALRRPLLGRHPSPTRRSTCSISTGGRCSRSPSKNASDSSAASFASIPASATPPMSTRRVGPL